tara:strand:+ start:18541 stop:19407 length:867 start_codon:yes stop_codon:yes gene_type:complete
MKIISWDIGIKNLAYCIMEENNNSNINCPVIIHDWNIINLAIENKCDYCDELASYESDILNNKYKFCCFHKHNHKKLIEEKLKFTIETNNICNYFIKSRSCNCNKICEFGINNKIYCKTHYNQIVKKIKLSNLEKIKNNVNKIPIEKIKLNLIKILDKNKKLLNVDNVVIENQPALKNPKMKAISDTLYTWFIIRGIIDEPKIKNINYCSPSNKLKIDEDNSVKLLSNTKNDTEKYKLTKQLAIIYCNQIIKDDKKNYDFFNKKKKKDDLADALLQGIYFIKIKSKLI